MRLSKAAVALLKMLEGFSATPYKDGPGNLTIGYGHMLRSHEFGVLSHVTEEEAHNLLVTDVEIVEKALEDLVTRELTQQQWDALVLFGYNINLDNLEGSSTLNMINEGDLDEVPYWMKKWNKITVMDRTTGIKKKIESAGLNRRRNAEANVWLHGNYPESI